VLLAAGLSLVLDPRFSRQLVKIVLVAVLIVVTAVLTSPSLGHSLLKATRLTSSSSASGSNIVRHAVQQQGIDDFEHSPADGVGLQVAAEATNVYIQELAAGGLLLFIGMQVFTIGGLAAAWRMRRDEVMAYPLLASLITAAVFDYIEADLTDRFYYVPAALVAGLSAVRVAQQRALAAEPAAEIHVPQRVGAVVR
jgi:O-antigen ligase